MKYCSTFLIGFVTAILTFLMLSKIKDSGDKFIIEKVECVDCPTLKKELGKWQKSQHQKDKDQSIVVQKLIEELELLKSTIADSDEKIAGIENIHTSIKKINNRITRTETRSKRNSEVIKILMTEVLTQHGHERLKNILPDYLDYIGDYDVFYKETFEREAEKRLNDDGSNNE